MIGTPTRTIHRQWVQFTLAVLGALLGGIGVAVRPTAAVVAAVVALVGAACLLLPVRHLPALLLAITIVMPSLVLTGIGGSGQARAIIVVLALALVRSVGARARPAVPGVLLAAIGAALAVTLISALVATARPAHQVGSSSDLFRVLLYPLAGGVGFLGAAAAKRDGAILGLARSVALLGMIAALLSVWYWAWRAAGLAPLSSSLWHQVASSSGFSSSRSLFPFVQDSPNLGAVIFVLTAAFAAPSLLLARRRRDRGLGVMTVIAALAAVLTTQSRTGLFAAGAAAVVYLLLVQRGGGKRAPVAVTLVLLVLASAFVFATFPAERKSGDTLQSRVQIWGQAERSFLNRPVLGHGFEYSFVGNFVEPASGASSSHNQSTHDDVLSALVDVGVVGGAVLVGVLGLMVVLARRALADPHSRRLGIGYSCMLAAFVVGGVDNSLTQSAAVATFEWLAFGMIAGVAPVAARSRIPRTRSELLHDHRRPGGRLIRQEGEPHVRRERDHHEGRGRPPAAHRCHDRCDGPPRSR
jgi:O-antigen ligase